MLDSILLYNTAEKTYCNHAIKILTYIHDVQVLWLSFCLI